MMLAGTIGTAYAESSALNDEQKSVINMLNLTVLSWETNTSKNKRIIMERTYTSLNYSIYPNVVDSKMMSQLRIARYHEKCRMINDKRDRL